MSAASSAGSPICKPDIISASASTTSSCRRSLTRIRVCNTQPWPLFISPAVFNPATVLSMSASSRMIAADLPPSSRLHPLELLAADRRDPPPAGGAAGERDLVDAGMPHQVFAGFPAARNDRHHPLGEIDFVEHSANHMASNGVSGAGLTTTAQPAISAGSAWA